MLVLMGVGLVTSRVVLRSLGTDDFGIYSAVAGFVALFTVLTASLSTAISRFLTFELGKGDGERLRKIFGHRRETVLKHWPVDRDFTVSGSMFNGE